MPEGRSEVMKTLTMVCTCDDSCDEPCKAHYRENLLQDMVIELKNDAVAAQHDIDALKEEVERLELLVAKKNERLAEADLELIKNEKRGLPHYTDVELEMWHHQQHNPKFPSNREYKQMPESYIPGLGTVRECLDCGCLVPGGPTRCKRCASGCMCPREGVK